ncbi:MAG: flagellar assembly protein FliW [Lachnospiraceae bacterium]
MLVETKWFGKVEIADDKIITFENGLMGFEDYKKYTIIYDTTEESNGGIMWLQSLDEVNLALPVIDPMIIRQDYDPFVDDEALKAIGIGDKTEFLVLVTMTVPSDIAKMTVNLKAPIVINAENLKACQLIAENEDYLVKFPIYELLTNRMNKED